MRLTKLLIVLGIFLTLLLIAIGIFVFFIHTCNISQDEKVTMFINQEIIFSSHEQSKENYFVKTCLIARWKECVRGLTYYRHKDLCARKDWVKCGDLEKTKIDQLEEIMDCKLSLEACLIINPNIILTK